MEKYQLTVEQIASYGQFLYGEERSPGTSKNTCVT